MGIKKFYSFFPKEICCEEESMDYYKEGSVAVDAMHSLYTKCIGIRNSGNDIINKNGESISHLTSLLKNTDDLISCGILPIYVFDNKNPQIKQDTINERRKIKNDAITKCDNIIDKTSDEYIKFFKRAYHLDGQQIEACKKALTYAGIPFVNAVNEADSQCAALTYKKFVNGVVSNDTDLLLFGATKIILGFDKTENTAKVIRLNDVIDYLTYKANIIRDAVGMKRITATHDTFIDFAIIMGTDYTKPITGISLDELFEIFTLNEFNMIKTVNYLLNLKSRDGHIHVPSDFIDKWSNARKYYREAKIVVPSFINTKMEKPKQVLLYEYLCNNHGIEHNLVNRNILSLLTYYDKMYAR